jgi:hypothetical protein
MDSRSLEYNVIVVKWGNKFTSEHVNRLYRMAKRNITLRFNFYCYTEDSTGIYDEINIIPLDESLDLEKWWWKLTLFKKNNLDKSINLFLDLDIVIQKNIDHLFLKAKHDKLVLIDRCFLFDYADLYFNGDDPAFRSYYNSSIMIWYNNENQDIYEYFIKNYKIYTNLYQGIDGFLSYEISQSRFLDVGWENYYYRRKLRTGDSFKITHDIRIEIPIEKYKRKGRVVANFDPDIPICVFNQCHEDIFYQGMENFLL